MTKLITLVTIVALHVAALLISSIVAHKLADNRSVSDGAILLFTFFIVGQLLFSGNAVWVAVQRYLRRR